MTLLTNNISLAELQELCANRLKHVYDGYLQTIASLELRTAMKYAMQQHGKYLRPQLIYAAGAIFGGKTECLDVPAAAVEMIHTYSLIHDDLPCMDNADLRRGQPTCHKVYGEGLAVLTGDALHTLAIQLMADHPAPIKTEKRLQMINILAKACGPYGMAAGQALDITILNDPAITIDSLLNIYHLKTGALFTACIELGRIAAGDDDENNETALREFGNSIGLAFQIQDDILDIQTSTQTSGKPQGIDAHNNKMTYPHLLGVAAANEKVESLYQQALESINYLGEQAHLLRELAKHMLRRDR